MKITEELSRFISVRPIKSKEDAASTVPKFVRFFEKQSRQTVRYFHTDGGYEFRCMLLELEEQIVEISVTSATLLNEAHSPNSFIECSNLLQDAKLPTKFGIIRLDMSLMLGIMFRAL